jgi:L-ascorbate metabolism protein UlaG (beta-lactamase superfamily)
MVEIALSHDQLIADITSTVTAYGKAAFWWLGQLSFVVKLGTTVVYVDPYLAPDPARQTPPLLLPSEVTNAAIVTGSHDHGDHIDPQAIPGIAVASPACRFVVPNPCVERVVKLGPARDRVIGLRPGRSVTLAGVKITAIKAKHEFFDQTKQGYPYLGYIFEGNGVRFYHSGDTLVYEGLVTKLKRCNLDAMFVPINGRDAKRYRSGCIGNMTYQEAVDLAGEVRPRLVVPAHYDMFVGNQADPRDFADYLSAKFPELPCWIGPQGQKVLF